MTNTPMTSREAFALYCVEQKSKGYWVVIEDDFIAGYEASQAQQAQTIAELVEALESSKEILDGEGVYPKQSQRLMH